MSIVQQRPMPAQSPFPVQSIPRSTSAKIEDQQGKLIAVGALVRYTNNQAYFILQHLDSAIAQKAVTISVPDLTNPLHMRIGAVFDKHPNRTFLPMYLQVHFNPEERFVLEHLVDQLAETTLGRHNLELRKNLTIDVFDSDGDAFLRDQAGFFVADRCRFEQITLEKPRAALGALKPSKDVLCTLVAPNATAEHAELLEFDGTLSNHNRTDFLLQFLFAKKNQVWVAKWTPEKQKKAAEAAKEKAAGDGVAREEQQEGEGQKESSVAGYLVGSNETVLCVYAEEQAIADALLAKYLEQNSQLETVSLCCTTASWPALQRSSASIKTRPIYRRHTRAVPSNIKHERIFALNIGMNIF